MTSTYLVHYKFKRNFFKLFDRIGEGTCEIDIENHTTETLSSEDLENIKECIKQTNKAYQVDVLSFQRLES